MQLELNAPRNFLPDKVPIVTQHEFYQLQELTPPTLQALDNLKSCLATSQNSLEADPLLHVHQNSQQPRTQIRWHTTLILISAILLSGFLYFLLRPHLHKLRCATIGPHNTTSPISPQTSPLQHRTPEPQDRDAHQNVIFSSYTLQHVI